MKKLNIWLLVLITIQLIYGAFMAGLLAAFAAITWPDMNGMWWPNGMLSQGSFLKDISHNLITVQFIHRGLAYLICIPVILWTMNAKKNYLQKVYCIKFVFCLYCSYCSRSYWEF